MAFNNQYTQPNYSVPNINNFTAAAPQNSTFPQTPFPQPTGGVYNLSSGSEIGNIPVGAGLSVGLCLSENLMYIKALQNGSPMMLGYRLVPLETQEAADSSELKKIIEALKAHEEKFKLFENQLAYLKDKVGGKNEWQL